MPSKKLLLLFFNIFFSLIFTREVYAQTSAELLSQHLRNLNTFQANFVETVQDTNGNNLQKSQGKVALMRPGLFRWETFSPNQQLIVADGKNIWIYDKDLAQVTQQKQNTANNAPGLLLSESVSYLITQFSIHQAADNFFKLTPKAKNKKDLFQSVSLVFQDNDLKKMILQDSLGQITAIIFSHSQINIKLSPNLFKFTPPKNIDTAKA